MTSEINANPNFPNGLLPLYDPTNGQDAVAWQASYVSTDSATSIKYAAGVMVDKVTNAILAGKAFVASTGSQTSSGTFTEGLSVFNPTGSGKTLYFFSAKVGVASARIHSLYLVPTTDPALGTAITPINGLAGGSASVASASYTNAGANISTSGDTLIETLYTLADNTTDFLDVDEVKVCPPGYGILMAVSTATNAWAATLKWWEA